MSTSGGSLASDDLDFLFEPSQAQKGLGSSDAGITISGELDKMNLADVFQTLAMSKMEGILRVRNAVETRNVYFHDGVVQYHLPEKIQSRRLAKVLVGGGLVRGDDMRAAVITHKQEERPLSEIVVTDGLVTQEDLAHVFEQMLQEDLYDLFTWTRGSFQFYKGRPDPSARKSFAPSPTFDVNGVMLEVARRADEWSVITDHLGTVDAFPLLIDGIDYSVLQGDHALIIEYVDGKHSIRDLAEPTLLGLFSCARAVLDLQRQGYVELAGIDVMLGLAEDLVAAGEHKRAMIAVQTILDLATESDLDVELTEKLAKIMQECGESKQAASLVLECGRGMRDPDDRLAAARYAYALHRDSVAVLAFLKDELNEISAQGSPEYRDVCSQLADALTEVGDHDHALATLEDLLGTDDDTAVQLRRARILHKANRSDEAVSALLKVAEQHKAGGQKARLATIYEQILKVDARRKDISKALRDLRTSKAKKVTQRALVGAATIGVMLVGYLLIAHHRSESRLQELMQQCQEHITAGKLQEATAVLITAGSEFPDDSRVGAMDQQLGAARNEERENKLREDTAKETGKAHSAADLVQQGRIEQALSIYSGMLESGKPRANVRDYAQPHLTKLQPRLQQTLASLKQVTPPEPDILQTEEQRAALLAKLRTGLQALPMDLAQNLLASKNHAIWAVVVDGTELQALLTLAAEVQGSIELARLREQSYVRYQAKILRHRQLDPVFAEARQCEKRYDFERALTLYQKLVAGHKEEDDMKAHFRDQVSRYTAIQRYVQSIADATKAGDFATAKAQLEELKRGYPNVPFDNILVLPVRVSSEPIGASVVYDGKEIGRTPILTGYRPGQNLQLRIELNGYYREEIDLTTIDHGEVRVVFARKPEITYLTDGPVERQPAAVGTMLYVADRAGVVYGIDPSRHGWAWRQKTGDLSGLLSRPLVHGDLLLVASIDGPLRALRQRDGSVDWQIDKVPTQIDPVICGRYLVAISVDDELLRVDPKQKTVDNLLTIPGTGEGQLSVCDNHVVVITRRGKLLRIDPRTGRVMWERDASQQGIPFRAAFAGQDVVMATDDGRLLAVDVATGAVRWTREGLGELRVGPSVLGDRVLQPTNDGLSTFSLASGEWIATTKLPTERWTAAPSTDGHRIFLTATSGVTVLDQKKFAVQYRLRGAGAACMQPFTTAGGVTISAFDKRQLLLFRQLP